MRLFASPSRFQRGRESSALVERAREWMKRGSDDLEIICFTSSNCFQAVTFYSTNTQRHIFGIAARFISSLQHLGSVLCVKTHVRNQSAAIRCRSASTVPRQDKAVIFKDLGIRTCVLAWEGGGRGGVRNTRTAQWPTPSYVLKTARENTGWGQRHTLRVGLKWWLTGILSWFISSYTSFFSKGKLCIL